MFVPSTSKPFWRRFLTGCVLFDILPTRPTYNLYNLWAVQQFRYGIASVVKVALEPGLSVACWLSWFQHCVHTGIILRICLSSLWKLSWNKSCTSHPKTKVSGIWAEHSHKLKTYEWFEWIVCCGVSAGLHLAWDDMYQDIHFLSAACSCSIVGGIFISLPKILFGFFLLGYNLRGFVNIWGSLVACTILEKLLVYVYNITGDFIFI